MTTATLKLEAVAVVVVAKFKPIDLQPSWFVTRDFAFRPEEIARAQIEIVHPDVVSFIVGEVKVQIARDRFLVSSTHPPSYDLLRDLVLNSFSALNDAPVIALGINSEFHFLMDSEDAWHTVGHRVAPKELWAGLLDQPGTLSLSVQGARTDGLKGNVVVRLEPSTRFNPGVFVFVNDHYDLGDSAKPANGDDVIDTVRRSWDRSLSHARRVAETLVSLK
jgi:hypothetical protein